MNKNDRLGVNVFNGVYPEAVRAKPKTSESVFNWLTSYVSFNPFVLSWLRRRFLNVISRQRTVIEAMDEPMRERTLFETRNQLIRYGFRAKFVGRLFVLIAQKCHWEESLSAKVTWGAFLMLKGCAVEINRVETEHALLLCACTVALTDVPVHWIVSDEYRASMLAEKNAPFFKILNIESPLPIEQRKIDEQAHSARQVIIVTTARLARNYLQDIRILGGNKGRLGLLLKKLDRQTSPFAQVGMKGLCFALVENVDFWLLEKGFSIVEMDQEQITLHELLCRYQRCAGSLLGPKSLDRTLWYLYKVMPIALFNSQQGIVQHCTFFKHSAQKWNAIATKLVQANQTGEKICLIVTTSESVNNFHNISKEIMFSVVKEMQGDIANEFEKSNIVVLVEPFPWLRLDEWLNDSACRLVIADFCDSRRLLHYIERRICLMPAISVEMLFSLEDKWLQHIEASSVHFWLKRLLAWREMVGGRVGSWLLRGLLTQVETRRRKLHSEMNRWLMQRMSFQKIK